MGLFKNIKHTLESCYLCIRFPFLYPRNRFSGLHYTNWNIGNYLSELYQKAYKLTGPDEHFELIVIDKKAAVWRKIVKWIYENPLQWIHCIPTYNELDAMDKGWRKTFGIQMCQEIKDALLDAGGKEFLKSYRINQLKEKFGAMCLYDAYSTEDVHKIIEKYEYISARTCISCGRPAVGMTEGWIEPYCKECAEKNGYDIEDERNFRKYGIEDNTWYGYYTVPVKPKKKKSKKVKDSSTNL